MSFRIVSYKKIDMTEDEYSDYQKLCTSYDRPGLKGEDLFKDLFEVNENGLIVYIKPLQNRQFSFEIMFFLSNLMQNQWLRYSTNIINEFINEKNKEINSKIKELNMVIEIYRNKEKELSSFLLQANANNIDSAMIIKEEGK